MRGARHLSFKEGEDAAPGVLARVGELLLLAVEEGVRRARVDVEVVLDARLVEAAGELVDLVLRDPLVGAAEQAEDRPVHLRRTCERALEAALRAVEAAVEPHRARQPELRVSRREERLAAAEAEADRDRPSLAAALGQRIERSLRVGLDLPRARLRH